MSNPKDYNIEEPELQFFASCMSPSGDGYNGWRAWATHKATGHVIIGTGSTRAECMKNIINNIERC